MSNRSTTQLENLKEHFLLFYRIVSEYKLISNAHFEQINTVYRSLTGIQYPYFNAILGIPDSNCDRDQFICEQLDYFRRQKIPFVWYVDEDSDAHFIEKLKTHNFTDIGIFQGVSGCLDISMPNHELGKDYTLEQVKNEKSLDEFNELLCDVFEIHGSAREMLKKVLWEAMQGDHPMMSHWVARKDDKVVSTVSTLIEGKMASFWNGATHPELRRKGLSTSLRGLALKDATERGCRTGASYLMAEGLALGICKKLGYQSNWRFHAYVAPIA